MRDADCIAFLQWALPRLRRRWRSYLRVRRQVCRRIWRRVRELRLKDYKAYQAYLEIHADEWPVLDGLCRVTISSFFRDRGIFEGLRDEVLPRLAETALARGAIELRCWSAGSASGEEPYSLMILWELGVKARFPGLGLAVVATDTDPGLLARAREGRYGAESVRDVPPEWLDAAFTPAGGLYRLRDAFRKGVKFALQDVREGAEETPFDVILCRNLAFTYFDDGLQREVAEELAGRLAPGGALVVGAHETLPKGAGGLLPWPGQKAIYRNPERP